MDTIGYFLIQATSDPTVDTVTPSSDPSPNGIPFGAVDNITFSLIASEQNEAQPITVDQNFFELNLVPLETTPIINPLLYSATPGPNGTIIGEDPEGDMNVTTVANGTISTSYVPEPVAASLLALWAIGLAARRRRR